VLDKLQHKGYVDDEKFARWWVENRNQTKGTSLRKLSAELRAKGVGGEVIEVILADSERSDEDELAKIIAKKHAKYPDEQKLIAYLARQGFRYDDIQSALSAEKN
jgi:regulatory protein